jgi:hypothetical protein
LVFDPEAAGTVAEGNTLKMSDAKAYLWTFDRRGFSNTSASRTCSFRSDMLKSENRVAIMPPAMFPLFPDVTTSRLDG